MPKLVALRAVFGQDEANHGTRRYRVDSHGVVQVPALVAPFLVGKGGFAIVEKIVTTLPDDAAHMPSRAG
ncbi:MAG TPA: hypothetical protein VGR45_02415 [Stellaceae bacterium]|nr:hypothetical protein [Stellaceae bacterium]